VRRQTLKNVGILDDPQRILVFLTTPLFFQRFYRDCNENNSNVVEPEAIYCYIPEKPNLKGAKTVKPYVASAWI
jgi:hypothetical protein